MTDITEIVTYTISLIMLIVTTFIAPAFERWLKSKVSATRLENARIIVRSAVLAAEQIFKSEDEEQTGEKKKAYVMELLAKQNLSVDTEVIEALVESYVADMNGLGDLF